MAEEKKCLCIRCKKRWGCDFSLSAWAAKRRMRIAGTEVSFITIECETFEEEKIVQPESEIEAPEEYVGEAKAMKLICRKEGE